MLRRGISDKKHILWGLIVSRTLNPVIAKSAGELFTAEWLEKEPQAAAGGLISYQGNY